MKKKGIIGLERLVKIERPQGLGVLIPKISIYFSFSLDENRVIDIVDRVAEKKFLGLEEFCCEVAGEILQLGSSDVVVEAVAEYSMVKETPISKIKTQLAYKIIARAYKQKNKLIKAVGVELCGISACPCAQEEIRKKLKFFNNIPIPTHNQRNLTMVVIEGHNKDLDVGKLIKIVEDSMSSSIYEILKREDEVEIVLRAHKNPLFVEDIVRNVLLKVKELDLDENSKIYVRSVSFESIHQHNAVAEKIVRFGELKYLY